MIALSTLIERYGGPLLERYGSQLLPEHRRALSAMRHCRTEDSPMMMSQCGACEHCALYPHSCGHRSCPHCQNHESQRWLVRQHKKRLPVNYFMITFTLPKELRPLAWDHPKVIYGELFRIAWETLSQFGLSDKSLQGKLGATGVLHTHTRRLDYHPHVHMIVPAGGVDEKSKLWRKKRGKYLFKQQNLAKVFRAKWLTMLKENKYIVKERLPEKWVVDCRAMGSGEKALVYLGRYLYRGVLSERNILSDSDGQVTFRYTDNKGVHQTRTESGSKFLWLLLRHVLPKGFRRARDYGFLHANSKRLIQLLQYLLHLIPKTYEQRDRPKFICKHCGTMMHIVAVRIDNRRARQLMGILQT